MEIKGMLFPGKEPEFSIGNLEAMEKQVSKITDENGKNTNGYTVCFLCGKQKEEFEATYCDKCFKKIEKINPTFIARCENCPNLQAHVHYNGDIRAIENGSAGINIIQYGIEKPPFDFIVNSKGE